MTLLQQKLDRGEVIILDGATGTELQRRGAPMHGVAWSAGALLTHPQLIRETHEDYIRAGADIITTNSFSTARHTLEPAGMGDQVRELNLQAVKLAQEARGNAAGSRPVFIAGSISTFRAVPEPEMHEFERLSEAQARANFREQAELLAEAGVDLILLEMLQDIEYATYAISEAVATGLPVWAGFSCVMTDDNSTLNIRRGGPFGQALEALLPLGGQVALVMHTVTEIIAPALEILQARWSGPTGAYAHTGKFEMPEWRFINIVPPEPYAASAQQWVQMGTQIIGGCCGIGPDHIRALKERLPSQIPPAQA